MKKTYSKPEVAVVDFSMVESIANGVPSGSSGQTSYLPEDIV